MRVGARQGLDRGAEGGGRKRALGSLFKKLRIFDGRVVMFLHQQKTLCRCQP